MYLLTARLIYIRRRRYLSAAVQKKIKYTAYSSRPEEPDHLCYDYYIHFKDTYFGSLNAHFSHIYMSGNWAWIVFSSKT